MKKKVEEISSKYNLNKLISTILANRNITTEEEIRLFLSPTRKDFHNPFLITDMEKISRKNNKGNRKQGKSHNIWRL